MFTASALLSFAAAAPFPDSVYSGSLEARQAPICNIGTQVNNADAYDSSCWDALDIMSYLTNWKATTTCGPSEPWSTCFLRLATKQNFYDCTKISTTMCPLLSSMQLEGLDASIASQVNYVVLNIVTINNFFSAYYMALQRVMSTEEHALSSVSSTFPQLNLGNVNVNLQNAMAALTLGLPFSEVPTTGSTGTQASSSTNDGTTVTSNTKRDIPSNTSCTYSFMDSYYQGGRHHRRQAATNCTDETDTEADSTTSNSLPSPSAIFTNALKQSPNVAMAMWPSTLNPATSSLTSLDGTKVASILTAGLDLIMSDVGTFIAFAGNGLFSTPTVSADQASGFMQNINGALATFILSEMLASNSMSATPGSVVSSNPCTTGPICASSYWSPVTGRQYSFKNSNMAPLITAWTQAMGANMPALFDGAYDCTFAGQAGGSVAFLNGDNSLNMSCMSALPMYISGSCPDQAHYVQGKCPFGHT